MNLKQYYRFWWRTCLVFCPLVFFILYTSGVSLTYSLLSMLGVAVIGLLLVMPFILVFSRVDREMWSPEEELKRKIRFQEKLRAWREEEYGPEEDEDEADDDEYEYYTVYEDDDRDESEQETRKRRR